MSESVIVSLEGEAPGELLSSVVKQETAHAGHFVFETDLTSMGEMDTVIKSPVYELTVDRVNPAHVTKWRIELDPNYVDENNTRHLSLWVRLMDSTANEVSAIFIARLITNTFHFDTNFGCYAKEAQLLRYTDEDPCHGFKTFVEMYRLQSQSSGNPNPDAGPGLLRFVVEMVVLVEDDYNPMAHAVNLDAKVAYQGKLMEVDSKRLSYYSSVFQDFYHRQAKLPLKKVKPFDLSKLLNSKKHAEQVIHFCMNGELSVKPEFPNELLRNMSAAKELGIPQLMTASLELFREKFLTVSTFAQIVTVIEKRGLAEDAMPMLMDFLLTNLVDIMRNDNYKKTYQQHKQLYSRYLMPMPKPKPKSGEKNDNDMGGGGGGYNNGNVNVALMGGCGAGG